jgi:SAM-dependent methyltransferase
MAPVTRAWPAVMGGYQRGARERPPIWFVAAVGICLANACDQPDKAVETPLPMQVEALPAPAPDNPARGPRVEPRANGSLLTFTTQNLATFEEQDARGALSLPSRETRLILDTLALQPGQAVADVGCGPGSMLYPFADVVGTSGKVYAVDVDPDAIAFVKRRLSLSQERYGRTYPQVQPVQNTLQDVGLPQDSLDAILLRHIQNYIIVPPSMGRSPLGEDVGEERWVEFFAQTQRSFTESMHANLRSGGKMLIIDRSRMPNGVLGMDGVQRVIEGIGGFRLVRSFPEWADPTDWALLFERVE